MKKLFPCVACMIAVMFTRMAFAQQPSLFMHPPDEAKPRVFWWWLEGYQTKEGILDDLSAMKFAGIKGAILFDAGSSSYNNMEKTQSGPVFLSAAWKGLFHYACYVADSLDLELSLNIGSGWNDGG